MARPKIVRTPTRAEGGITAEEKERLEEVSGQFQDLIARLEAAHGPDRELDCEIARIATDCRWSEIGLTRYTASIDAALTLVPDGLNWACSPEYELRAHRVYRPYNGEREWPEWRGEHKHDALALCIAALRARASLSGKGEAS